MRITKAIYAVMAVLVTQSVVAQDYHSIERADSADARPIGVIGGRLGPKADFRFAPYVADASLPTGFLQFSPANSAFLSWLDITSSRQSLPGLMGIESATATARFSNERLSFEPHAQVIRYGYLHGVQTSYGIGATIGYNISDRLSLTVFGSYFTPTHAPTPAIAGYMQTSRIGGYATWRINERWSLSAGAQTINTPSVINKWQTVPILIPTYHVNSKVSLGVDIGGILYDIAESIIDNHSRDSGPTFRAPSPGPKRDMFSGGDPSQPRWNK